MRDVYDYAKFFIKNGADSMSNTFDGNMKLQKLLVFTNLASIAEYGEPLFDEEVDGSVIEKIRLRYEKDCLEFKIGCDALHPIFSDEEHEILNLVMGIFGGASAKELSEICHIFDANDKQQSIVDTQVNKKDIERMREIIYSYKESLADVTAKEIINDIVFYYDNIVLTDEMIDQLEKFSLSAKEDTYTVYVDDGRLVVY